MHAKHIGMGYWTPHNLILGFHQRLVTSILVSSFSMHSCDHKIQDLQMFNVQGPDTSVQSTHLLSFHPL